MGAKSQFHQSTSPETTRQDRSVDNVINGIRRLFRSLRLFSREVERDFGVSAAQLFVLQSLEESTGPESNLLSINELAERSFTHQSTVSEVVARLKKKKLVLQRKSEEDLRKTLLELSSTGKHLIRHAPKSPQVRLIRALLELSMKEREQLAQLLGRVLRSAGFEDEPASMFFEEDARKRKRRPESTARR